MKWKIENSPVSLRPAPPVVLTSGVPVRADGGCSACLFHDASHLLSTASPGAQEQARKLTEPRSHPRGLAEGVTEVDSRGRWTCWMLSDNSFF